ncbi:MAG: hypothetical protein KC457_35630, partial [Myxococcales bacterium]|nr:hypothetical protein [Myxococcales bacterium]
DELDNDITKVTPASFEPSIDYIVTKIPRFAFEKFKGADDTLTIQMKSVGEAMAIGRTVRESLGKAMRSMETETWGFDLAVGDIDLDQLEAQISRPTPSRLWLIGEALRRGMIFDDREVGVLVGQILPEVRKHLPVSIDSARLPGGAKIRPQIQLKTSREGDGLQVLATIVYGDPPIARVDGDRMRLVEPKKKAGKKAEPPRELPVRNVRVEKLLRERLRERFGLEPGQRKIL